MVGLLSIAITRPVEPNRSASSQAFKDHHQLQLEEDHGIDRWSATARIVRLHELADEREVEGAVQVPVEVAGGHEVQAPWYVAGGWSIDLFLGVQRRVHEDLEVAVPHDRFSELAAVLTGFEFYIPMGGPGNGLVYPFDAAGDFDEEHHQTWVREPTTDRWRLDIFREPADGGTWICRRDARIQLPYHDVIEFTQDGIPYSCPEVTLLFKAKHSHLAKNQVDFAVVLPRLEPARRRWLSGSIALVHPGHSWLAMLAD